MPDVRSDAYWTDEFQATHADLDRIETHIRRTGQAHDLTTLARRVVRGRLRHGPESSAPAQPAWAEDPSVRLWDPAGEWKEGDHVVIAVGSAVEGQTLYEPYVGEIVAVEPGQVRVQIDALGEARVYYTRIKYSDDDLRKWRRFVKDLVEAKRRLQDMESQVDFVILKHGERVLSQLLDALRADDRFVRLAGRWFLRDLAAPPSGEQLSTLAWAMVPLEAPQPTEALAPLVQPPLAEGDPGLFGLYLAMRERTDLFRNVDPGKRPRWV
ncbi:MAG TPA: hypothetical protein EYH30_07845, partial [Anaerolineales bacterium]|nr:hypothetical protein [Anaerolineales bacterium]